METILRSRICSADMTLHDEIKYRDYGCKTICVDHRLNGGDCGGPGRLVGYERQCVNEVDIKNKTIRAYNSFVRFCSRGQRQTTTPNRSSSPAPDRRQSPSSQGASRPTNSALDRALQRQKDQAKDADKTHEKNKSNAENFARAAKEEKTELDDIRERQEEVRRNQERIRRQIEAEYIPPGWNKCSCPHQHFAIGKVVHGVRYHPPGPSCH